MAENRPRRESNPRLDSSGGARGASPDGGGGDALADRRLREFVEGSIQGVLVHQDFRPVIANQALADLLDYDRPDEILALDSVERLLHAEDLSQMRERVRLRLQGQMLPPRVIDRWLRKDGTSIWLEGLARRIEWNGGPAILITVIDVSRTRAAEEALRTIEARTNAILNTAVDGIITIDTEGIVDSYNAACHRIFGYAPEEVIGRNVNMLMEEPYRSAHDGYLQRYLETGQAGVIGTGREVEGRRKDGTNFPIDLSVSEFRVGAERRFAGIVRDISERKAGEAALRESEARHRQLFESAVLGIVIHEGFQPVQVNQAFARIFGYDSPEEVLALESLDALHAPQERERLRGYARARGSGEPAPTYYEFEGRRRDGTPLWLDCRVSTTRDGRRTLFVSTVADISAQKAAQQALRDSEQRYRSLVEGSVQGIVVHRDLKPLFANRTCARIFGCPSPRALQELADVGELVAPEESERLRAALSEIDVEAESAREVDFEGHRRDGRPIGLECVSREIVWRGEPAIQSVLLEVSERRKLEAQLRQSQKMEAVGQLAGGIAHDFNNMLQIIQGFAELAEEQKGDPAGWAHSLDQIRNAAERATVLTRQLLAFSRRQMLEPKYLNLNDLIANVLRMLERLIGENVIVQTRLDPMIGMVYVDPGAIEQVMVNLAINARDAMPNGGRLVITTEPAEVDETQAGTQEGVVPGPYVRLIVSDSGMGMTEDVLRRVFEPFFTTKSMGEGTGLGLSMVYGIVRQHDGMISAYSEPGRGTAIHIFLPVASGHNAPEHADARREAPTGQERILVAEDDAGIREFLCGVLQAAEYEVVPVTDGEQAVARFTEGPESFDLVLLDMVMPNAGGRETYESIVALRPGIPVVFISGFSPHLLDTGFVSDQELKLLSKPFSVSDLLHAVRNALDRNG